MKCEKSSRTFFALGKRQGSALSGLERFLKSGRHIVSRHLEESWICMLFFRYGNSDNISPAAGGVSDETETDAKAVDQSAEYGDQ